MFLLKPVESGDTNISNYIEVCLNVSSLNLLMKEKVAWLFDVGRKAIGAQVLGCCYYYFWEDVASNQI